MGTAVVSASSDLVRKKWMLEGLVQAQSKSFWSPFTGNSSDSVIYQVNNESAGDGHTVVFDFSGKISGKAVKGKDTAYGKGETKRKFSDKITVERYRNVVDNGDKFDGVNIGDLSINEHSDSRGKLADLYVRSKDQMIFDALSGALNDSAGTSHTATHRIGLASATALTYADLLTIEKSIKTGSYTSGSSRAPLEPFMLENGEPVWLFVIDGYMAASLRADTTGFQAIMQNADVRGANNRLISGIIGKVGRLLVVEASNFFGYTDGTGEFGIADSEIEIAGLRRYGATTVGTPTSWEGQTAFSGATKQVSRGLVLGKSAAMVAMGKMPDYKFQESTDFGITSESAVEYWTEAKKCILTLESGSAYKAAKIASVDFGVVVVDMENA